MKTEIEKKKYRIKFDGLYKDKLLPFHRDFSFDSLYGAMSTYNMLKEFTNPDFFAKLDIYMYSNNDVVFHHVIVGGDNDEA